MNKKSIYTLLIVLTLFLSSCGSNNKEDGTADGSILGKITTVLKNMTIDKDNGNVSANVGVTSTYASTVSVTLTGLDIVLGGCTLIPGTVISNPDTVTLDSNTPTKDVVLTGTMVDPSCVPTSYQLTGTNTLVQNGQTTTESFTTDVVTIPPESIDFEDISLLKLEILDKQLDINVSDVEKPIRIRVTQGSIGIKNQKVKVVSTVPAGSFLASDVISDDAGDAVFTYKAPNPMVDNNFSVQFCLEDNGEICDTANIHLTTSVIIPPINLIDDINYFITFVPNGGVYNLALDARNNTLISLIDKDTKESIPNSRIKSITLKSQDKTILKLTPEGGGAPVGSINFGGGRNDVSALMTADKINAGLAPVEVIIEYFNLNGVLKTRGQLFTIAVLSGEPTAFSINGNGVVYNATTKQFEHKFIVQATDASSNPISSTGIINVSAMASFAKDATNREILYGRFSGGVSATLSPDNDKAILELTTGGLTPFNTTNIKENRAFVAVFGDVETYEANGKWNLEKGSLAGDTLKLNNSYSGEVHADLGMAVGYNFRDKFCTSAFEESVIVVDSTDGTYQLNEDGQAVVTLKHDAYMIGKRAMILVNMTGLNPNTGEIKRTGEVHDVTLKHHLHLVGESFPIPKNGLNVSITLPGLINTGGIDEYAVINSTFSCLVKLDAGITGISPVTRNDPSSCVNGGRAFISYEVNASGDGGTVTFEKCQVNNEPLF